MPRIDRGRAVSERVERPLGHYRVRRLPAEADVLIEGFAPGEVDRLGLGPARLRAANPGLVVTSLSAFGQDGPCAGWRGSDPVNLAMRGYPPLNGGAGRPAGGGGAPPPPTGEGGPPPHSPGGGSGPPLKPSVPFQSYLHASM